jgi:hypothetical protein
MLIVAVGLAVTANKRRTLAGSAADAVVRAGDAEILKSANEEKVG